MTRGRIVVAYDKGVVGPREIHASLNAVADLVFVVPDTPHTRSMGSILPAFGTVLPAEDGVTRRLAALAPDGIVTFSERMLPHTADLAAALGLRFPAPDTVRLLTDKHAQRRCLAKHGVDTTRSFAVTDAGQWRAAVGHTGLPAVVKPLRGEGSRNTHRLDSPADAFELISELLAAERRAGVRHPALVVEEYLRGRDCGPFGDYVSVESVVSTGTVHHAALTGKFRLVPPFREVGQFWPALLEPGEQHEVLALVTAAVRALGIPLGVTHTELKLTEQGPRIIEVNGRLGGAISELTARTGHIDLLRAAADLAMGQDVTCDLFAGSRVHFQYHNPAPVEGGRLDEVNGIRDVRAIPGISGYRQLVRPGTTLEPGVTTCRLDTITGDADRHEQMLSVLDRALSALVFRFTGADGRSTARTGHDLNLTTHVGR